MWRIKLKWFQFIRWFGFFKFNFIRFFNRYYQSWHDNIKEIVFYLENFDQITIERRYIGEFHLGDFSRTISRMAANHIGELVSADKFWIEIHADANTQENNPNYGERYIFDRLTKHNDIVSVKVVYKTGKSESYYVDYDEDGNDVGEGNILQDTKINSFGDLFITIGKEVYIDEVFASDEYEKENARDFKWKMYE